MSGTFTPTTNGIILHNAETVNSSIAKVNVDLALLKLDFNGTYILLEEEKLSYRSNNGNPFLSFTPTTSSFRQTFPTGWAATNDSISFYLDRFNNSGLFLLDSGTILGRNSSTYLILEDHRVALKTTDGLLLDLNQTTHQITLSRNLGLQELILADLVVLKQNPANYVALSSTGVLSVVAETEIRLLAPTITSTVPLGGVTGLQGVTGSLGAQGNTGLRGLTGLRGRTGITGHTGTRGRTGIQGKTGLTGKTGLRGLTGIRGLTGVSGRTGIKGNTGLKGSTGIAGSSSNYPILITDNTDFINIETLLDGTSPNAKNDIRLTFLETVPTFDLSAETPSIASGYNVVFNIPTGVEVILGSLTLNFNAGILVQGVGTLTLNASISFADFNSNYSYIKVYDSALAVVGFNLLTGFLIDSILVDWQNATISANLLGRSIRGNIKNTTATFSSSTNNFIGSTTLGQATIIEGSYLNFTGLLWISGTDTYPVYIRDSKITSSKLGGFVVNDPAEIKIVENVTFTVTGGGDAQFKLKADYIQADITLTGAESTIELNSPVINYVDITSSANLTTYLTSSASGILSLNNLYIGGGPIRNLVIQVNELTAHGIDIDNALTIWGGTGSGSFVNTIHLSSFEAANTIITANEGFISDGSILSLTTSQFDSSFKLNISDLIITGSSVSPLFIANDLKNCLVKDCFSQSPIEIGNTSNTSFANVLNTTSIAGTTPAITISLVGGGVGLSNGNFTPGGTMTHNGPVTVGVNYT